ncbi:gibberellin-regulated protein 1-like isoform X1 [Salvia splendens]|uniref:gibberellin-regulated protein 1-like isoform X1 n=1 Tax=Salvia splendens TaxID=180675 RepID=UPI001C26CE47|nr:gibberellin-regulated protein 1-like isoform X1 [Salvia splendens]
MAHRLLLLLLLLISLALVSSDIESGEETTVVAKGNNRRLLDFVDCGQECKRRCSLHSRPNVCNRACGTCCQRCKCVPPGTHGNREVCGSCYTDMTTHRNRTKCP